MWQFWIDTGGTFTDCLALSPLGKEYRVKVLSSSEIRVRVIEVLGPNRFRLEIPFDTVDDFFVGYRLQVCGLGTGLGHIVTWSSEDCLLELDLEIPSLEQGALCAIQSLEEPPILGMRLITQTLLGEALPHLELRLATTRGTNALLEGKGARAAFFVTRGFRDLLRIGNQQRPDLFELGIKKREPLHSLVFEVSERLDAKGSIIKSLCEEEVRSFAVRCREEGIESVAVALLHSYRNSDHEQRIGEILRMEGINHVSLSHELSAKIKILQRAETSMVDAYLAPIMDTYLDAVQFVLSERNLRIMTSAGGLVSRTHYRPKDSLLSGPAGGVVGSSSVGKRAGIERGIAFDMGGTSTDVSRFEGRLDYQFEQVIGGAKVFAPSLRIKTVAAGGGSCCWFDGSALRVGPESAGAWPGPACYGAGGGLTLTDVNLLLGRIEASEFGIPIFPEAAAEALDRLVDEVQARSEMPVAESDLLQGLLDIANEHMADAIRSISIREGYDPSEYALVAFGGAGGLHACAIADILEMDSVLFPLDAGLLSSYGLQQASVETFKERQILRPLKDCKDEIEEWKRLLKESAYEALVFDGELRENLEIRASQVEIRFLGQESGLLIDLVSVESLEMDFKHVFEAQYGFIPEQTIEVVSIKVSVGVRGRFGEKEMFEAEEESEAKVEGRCDRGSLTPGTRVVGPSVVQDRFSTVYVEAGWEAIVGSRGSIKLKRDKGAAIEKKSNVEFVELELYTNRFLSLVEEMGNLLERSAFSTNVKERKDFSCALLDSNGSLIANAPHIPVHLGALGVCVRNVSRVLDLKAGDVAITNHPGFGGSHLPDLTLIAPVFTEEDQLIGYVANRAHHAELGGISPGSMPPNAKSLEEEGVVFEPAFLMRDGKVDWSSIERTLTSCTYPTRRLRENLSDLAAQLASIRFGESELRKMVGYYELDTIYHYMASLKKRATGALRSAFAGLTFEEQAAEEYLDNDAPIAVRISQIEDKLVIDYAGSAEEQLTSYNATPAIVKSATLYALRLLANQPIPLNEGFMDVVNINIPEGMLSPRFDQNPASCPPVVAGNVEVSQRIVDTLIKAFGLAACSQGTMNNLIFGNHHFSYYETIAGGEGATSTGPGADGVHTHMTNTEITDPEILEFRFPVTLEVFEIRENSGGGGRYKGGEGLRRRIRFSEPVIVSLLTQHRMHPPFGLEGGGVGALGSQCRISLGGKKRSIEGNGSFPFEAGEAIEILTPGGGGWGSETG